MQININYYFQKHIESNKDENHTKILHKSARLSFSGKASVMPWNIGFPFLLSR